MKTLFDEDEPCHLIMGVWGNAPRPGGGTRRLVYSTIESPVPHVAKILLEKKYESVPSAGGRAYG